MTTEKENDSVHLLQTVCQSVVPEIYQANQEDFELDGYRLDEDSQRVVLRVASHILYSIFRNLAPPPTDALLPDWVQSLEAVFPGKSGLKKVLSDAIAFQHSMHDLETTDTFSTRHFKSIAVFTENLPALVTPPSLSSESKYVPPACHVAIELAEIALCEVMQTISVYADDHNLLDKSIKADNISTLHIDSVRAALQQDPDFAFCRHILFLD